MCGGASVRVAVVRIVAGRVAMARMRFVSGEEFFVLTICTLLSRLYRISRKRRKERTMDARPLPAADPQRSARRRRPPRLLHTSGQE